MYPLTYTVTHTLTSTNEHTKIWGERGIKSVCPYSPWIHLYTSEFWLDENVGACLITMCPLNLTKISIFPSRLYRFKILLNFFFCSTTHIAHSFVFVHFYSKIFYFMLLTFINGRRMAKQVETGDLKCCACDADHILS